LRDLVGKPQGTQTSSLFAHRYLVDLVLLSWGVLVGFLQSLEARFRTGNCD
jgi:hypothetical protein